MILMRVIMKVWMTVICLCAAGLLAKAESNERKYEKSCPKAQIEELMLSNQYGKIEISQTDGDEIKVEVNMRVSAKTGAKADETLDLIRIAETATDEYLHFKTEFDKNMGLAQFLTSTSLSVDYAVKVPKGIRLRLVNTNGDVYLSDFAGDVDADLKTGDFKATALTGGELYIKQEKGTFDVEKVATMKGEFRSCTLRIASGDEVRLETNSCDGTLTSMGKLNVRSSGGAIKIGDVEELTGSSSFTKYEVQDLGNYMDMDMKMGEMNIRNVQLLFSEIRLKSSFTKVGLSFMKGSGYALELKRNKSLKLDLPKEMTLEEKPTSERNVIVSNKFVGDPKYAGKVFLELSNGSLFITN